MAACQPPQVEVGGHEAHRRSGPRRRRPGRAAARLRRWVSGWSTSTTRSAEAGRAATARVSNPAPSTTTCAVPSTRSATVSSISRVRATTEVRTPGPAPVDDAGDAGPVGPGEPDEGPVAPAEERLGQLVVDQPLARAAGRLEGPEQRVVLGGPARPTGLHGVLTPTRQIHSIHPCIESIRSCIVPSDVKAEPRTRPTRDETRPPILRRGRRRVRRHGVSAPPPSSRSPPPPASPAAPSTPTSPARRSWPSPCSTTTWPAASSTTARWLARHPDAAGFVQALRADDGRRGRPPPHATRCSRSS